MNMLSNKIDGIYLKVKELSLKLEQLQKANTSLKKENTHLKADLSATNFKLEELENKLEENEKLMGVRVEEGQNATKTLKKEIDQYITKIDKCIDWLNNN